MIFMKSIMDAERDMMSAEEAVSRYGMMQADLADA